MPVKEEHNKLSVLHSLKTLAEQGITSVLVEGGQEVLRSYISENIIDQIYIYTSLEKLNGANLKNPFQLSDEWSIIEERSLGEDKLIIANKGAECLQEL